MNISKVSLDEVFWFQEGPGVRNWQFQKEGIKLLNVANIEKNGQLNLGKTDRHLAPDEANGKYAHFLLDEGDLVIASSGISFDTDGMLRTRGAFVEREHLPLCLNTSTIRFKPKDGRSDLKFLRHWLDGSEFRGQITKLVTGSAQQNFGPTHLKALRISVPPLEEQRRIAAILDQAETLRTQRRTALALLDSLTQSLFLDMFGDPVANDRGWPKVTVNDFVAGFESGKSLVADDEEDSASKYRVLKVSAVTSLEYKPEQSKAVPTDYTPPQSHIVRAGDLLFSRANTSELIGATAYVEATPDNLLLPDKLWRFVWHAPSQAAPLYVMHLFRQPKFRQEIGQRASGTSGSMKNISQEKVLSIQVGNPPLPLQQTFAARIASIEALKATHRRALAALDALFASLQQRAFAGQL